MFVAAGLAIAGYIFVGRWTAGEYAIPSVQFYRLQPSASGLSMDPRDRARISPDAWSAINAAGITGELEWTSGYPASKSSRTVVVVSEAKPVLDKDIHFPRAGSIVYYFDGSKWELFPADTQLYDYHATIVAERECNRLVWTLANGGQQYGPAFCW